MRSLSTQRQATAPLACQVTARPKPKLHTNMSGQAMCNDAPPIAMYKLMHGLKAYSRAQCVT